MSPPGPECLISVVIPTWNRRELMREVIASLWSQTLPADRYEVIVVDNCSNDGTAEMFAELAPHSPCRLVYHRMPENRGPVRSRNAGARIAQAPLLAFTDSDCCVAPDWLEIAVRSAERDPQAAMFSGTVRNKPGQRVRFFCISAVCGEGENRIYPTCNVVYRRDVFWRMNGFDEAFNLFDAGSTPVECSDADLAWRTKAAGFQTRFIPELLVYHDVREVRPLEWLGVHVRVVFIPELIRRYPGLREFLVWWGPFCLADNLLFYIAGMGIALGVFYNPWCSLAALAFLARMVRVAAPGASPRRLLKLPAQLVFLSLRQGCICGSLIYGSCRARRLVL